MITFHTSSWPQQWSLAFRWIRWQGSQKGFKSNIKNIFNFRKNKLYFFITSLVNIYKVTTRTYSFTVDIDIFQGISHHVINGTGVLIINSRNINSYAKFPFQVLNIYRIIIGVTQQKQE